MESPPKKTLSLKASSALNMQNSSSLIINHRPKVEELENKLRRAYKMTQKADFLGISLVRDNSGNDIWMRQNEPHNRIDNVLKDDQSSYHNRKPMFEFNLHNDELCYVANIMVDPTEPAPGETEILVSSDGRDWKKVKFTVEKDKKVRDYVLFGDNCARALRIHFLNNDRKGNFVGIRNIKIKGTRQAHILN